MSNAATWDEDNMAWFDLDEILLDRETSYYVVIDNENFWLPKSAVILDEDDLTVGVPRELALEKGLIDE